MRQRRTPYETTALDGGLAHGNVDAIAIESAMPAFVWNTNHRMWKVVPPFTDSFDVLKAYICDPCGYVYWSTPRFQDEIKVGDTAYILRTADDAGRDGIVARGRVEETPRQLMKSTLELFAFPERLTPAGWDEQVAPSFWKTGIRIEQTFWDEPIKGIPPAIGTVGKLSEERVAAVEGEAAKR
jgi:hypothetical protein